MAIQPIDLDTPQPNGKFGDPLRTAWAKANQNFQELTSPVVTGTYATRPAYTEMQGRFYYAQDTKETYAASATGWVLLPSGGAELGYAQRTSGGEVVIGTDFGVIDGLALTFVVGENPVYISYRLTVDAQSPSAIISLDIDGTQVQQSLIQQAGYRPVLDGYRLSGRAPGSTVSVRLRARHNASTVKIFFNPIDVGWLKAESA